MVTWSSHQQIRNRKSKYPPPPGITCEQLKSIDFKCPRNPIQSESNPNPNPYVGETDDEEKFTQDHVALAERLKKHILTNKPDARVPDDLTRWADTARLMEERDGRSVERIKAVMDWCQSNDFWKANILSMGKLREKFDQLELKMQARASPKTFRPHDPSKEDWSNEPDYI